MSKFLNKLLSFAPNVGKVGVGLFLVAGSLTSCSDIDKYFETPSWLRGSIYETLEQDGNYTQFLAGAEKAGYRPLLEGKSILTVMAPNDESMKSYLSENYGKSDITELDAAELKKLIGFHLFYYSFTKEMLTNFRPDYGDGATDEQKETGAGMYYKFRSRSQDTISIEQDVIQVTDAGGAVHDSIGEPKAVYHLERYVPVLSYNIFNTKTIAADYNYNYFYPDTKFDNAGFNISNAAVTEYAVPTSNGYIYRVDRVVKPLETIYNELQKRPEYSRYFQMYNKYRTYEFSQELTDHYGNGTNLYQIMHPGLAPIALEWPVTNYQDVTALASKSYTVFPFTDKGFEDFFNDFWGKGGYSSPDDPELAEALRDLLNNSFYSQSIVFPEEITKGLIKNSSNNEAIVFDVEEVKQENRVMCANGAIYGCSTLTPPAKYGSVTGPAYQYKKYSCALSMLNRAGIGTQLGLPTLDFIMLYPSDASLYNQGGYEMKYLSDDATERTMVSTEFPNGVSSQIQASACKASIVQTVAGIDDNLIANGLDGLLSDGKNHVLRTFVDGSKVYWYIKNGKITNSIMYLDDMYYSGNPASEDDIWASLTRIQYRGSNTWSNGHCYEYNNAANKIFLRADFDGTQMRQSNFFTFMAQKQSTSADADFYGWFRLLVRAGLFNESTGAVVANNFLEYDASDVSLTLVPTTDALKQAIVDGKIPGISTTLDATADNQTFFTTLELTTDPEELKTLRTYLKSYFIPTMSASITNIPYVGWGETTSSASSNGLATFDFVQEAKGDDIVQIATCVNFYDNGSKLSVERVSKDGVKGAVRPSVVNEFPYTFQNQVVYFLDNVMPLINGK